MKKFLALVLALVMTMSLVTIGSSAAFVDADSIEYTEAVNVLNGLGVIAGKGGNSFDPKGGVTRAEMAKMITFIDLGVVQASAFEGTKTDLTDVDGHWAEAYIKYCYSQGIIAGKGDGKFAPDAPVTGAEAAKMLLVALGWNATVQGYIGEQWQVNTMRDAYENDIFEGIEVGANAALTRDQSAKLIYNTILTGVVIKNSSMDREDGSIGDAWVKQADSQNLLLKTFKADKYTGQLNFNFTNGYNSATGEYTYTNWNDVNGEFLNDDDVALTVCKAKADYTDLLGEEVTVVAKKLAANKYDVLGIYATGRSAVIQDVANKFEVDNGQLKYDGAKYNVPSGFLTYLKGACVATNDDYLKMVDFDGDGEFEPRSTLVVETAKVSVVNSTEVVVSGGVVFSFEDDHIADGIAVDDYVSYYENADGSYSVTEIEPFEAVATAKHATKEKVEFDGTWYNTGAKTNNYKVNFTAGSTYRIWAHNGVVVDSKLIDGKDISNLAMYIQQENDNFSTKVQYITAAGEKKVANIDTKGGTGIVASASALVAGQLYMISETSDGVEFYAADLKIGDYVKSTYDAGSVVGGVDADGEFNKVAVSGNSYIIADDAVVFVAGANKSAAVLSGAQFKALKPSHTIDAVAYNFEDADQVNNLTGAATRDVYAKANAAGLNSRAMYLVVDFMGDASKIYAVSGTEIYAYVTSDANDVSINNENYVRFTIWNGTEHLTVYDKGTVATNNYAKGKVITYKTIDENGVIDGIDKSLSAVTGAVYAVDGSFVSIDSSDNGYKVTSDTKYLYINSNADTAAGMGSAEAVALQKAQKNAGIVMDNIAYLTDSTGKNFTLVVVDIGNSMTRGNTYKLDAASCEGIASVTSAKDGDRIEFNFADAATGTYTIYGVVDVNGNSNPTCNAGDKIIVYANGNVDGDIYIA